MIYKMKLIESEFNNIKYRGKIIEVRINDEKRKSISKGDKIIFYKLPNMEEMIQVKVEQVFNFSSFHKVYENFPISYFGHTNIDIKNMINRIYQIYTKEEEIAKGVLAIKFKLDDI